MVVFHLKRKYFEMIRDGLKTSEYRFSIPSSLLPGSSIRFDLGYRSLSDKDAHVFAICTSINRVRLLDCPQYVFDCFGYDKPSVDSGLYIYRIDFSL